MVVYNIKGLTQVDAEQARAHGRFLHVEATGHVIGGLGGLGVAKLDLVIYAWWGAQNTHCVCLCLCEREFLDVLVSSSLSAIWTFESKRILNELVSPPSKQVRFDYDASEMDILGQLVRIFDKFGVLFSKSYPTIFALKRLIEKK